MGTDGRINDLGRQYIGANAIGNDTSGVATDGNGDPSGPLTASALFGPLAVALSFAVLLI